MSFRLTSPFLVIPAQAGIQGRRRAVPLGPRFRADDDYVSGTRPDVAYFGEHARPNLIAVVEGKDVIGKAGALQNPVRAALTLDLPPDALKGR